MLSRGAAPATAAVPVGAGAAPVAAGGMGRRKPWPALREELQLEPANNNRDGSPAWHVCDPVRNLFFRIGWLEFEILQRWSMGDARRIAADIAARTTLAATPEHVESLQAFLLHHQLVRAARPKAAVPAWRWLLDNYLFIRIPLVRPQQWLDRLLPRVRWLYTPGFVIATLLAALAGLLLAARQWDAVLAQLRGALSWEGILGFAGALIVSKLLHELGHALTATRHGVRVGHMGIAFLVLWPMAYTDTGESWKLERSKQRFAIAAAGICTELALAAWCTLLWAFLPDGDARNALFFLATTAWVLTLAVNGSPFMRFDGYYMLTDALDFPGLHERAGQQARRALRRWLLDLHEPAPEVLSTGLRRFLIGFAFATWIYRFILFLGIALLVYHAFFKALGVFLFVVEIAVFIGRPVMAELRVWHARRAEIPVRRRLLLIATLGLAAGLLLLPWQSRISAPGVVRAFEQPVFAPYGAQLIALDITEGSTVTPGQRLLTLDAPAQGSARDKAAALASAYADTARGALGLDQAQAARLALAEQQASRWQAERSARDAELQRLQLIARHAGVVRDLDPLLAPGVWVAPSQPIAVVVDAQRWRAEVLVSERQRQRLLEDQPATLVIEGRPRKLQGRILAIDGSAVRRLPHLLLAQPHGGPIPLNPSAPAAALEPAAVWFRVIVEGRIDEGPPLPGVRAVSARLEGQRESLASQWLDAAVATLIQQAGF